MPPTLPLGIGVTAPRWLLLLLTITDPPRLVVACFTGVAVLTLSADLLGPALLNTAGLTTESSSTASG